MPIPKDQVSTYERMLQARAVAVRYGTHLRTISRWVARGVIPPPDMVINGRRYWSLSTLDQADRQRTVEAGARAAQPANSNPAAP